RRGAEVGRHAGAAGFTVGQRRGLGVSLGERVFVTSVDASANVLTIGSEQDLLSDIVELEDLRFVGSAPVTPARLDMQVRYRSSPVPGELHAATEGSARFHVDRPLRAVSPGQAGVFYDRDEVVGGGIITAASLS
ncbi:MAG TPA: aminomethyltransferase beta-barrel domain-containing protein, partial [Dehalococcoidia bacterium]|nr:aminomethyltransferase beta-barrel domain-containing protein [Dehalococcoidia bacterium]